MSNTNTIQKKNTQKESDTMAKKSTPKFTVADAFEEVVSALDKFRQTAVAAGIDLGEEPDEVEEDDEEAEEVELTREMVDEAVASGIRALRELAAEFEIEETKKADILAAFDELLGDEEEEEEDEEDEEDEEEDEEDEEDEEEYDRDELEELDLKELRKVARDAGHTAADYKGMDQDALIDLIMGEEEEEEDEDEEEEDEDVEELDEDALKAMTQKDLISLAKELEIKVPTALKKQSAANKKKLVDLILDSGDED